MPGPRPCWLPGSCCTAPMVPAGWMLTGWAGCGMPPALASRARLRRRLSVLPGAAWSVIGEALRAALAGPFSDLLAALGLSSGISCWASMSLHSAASWTPLGPAIVVWLAGWTTGLSSGP